MLLLRPLLAVASVALLAAASSVERNPLRLLTTVEDPAIRTQSRRVTALTPKFDLTFDVFDRHRRIRLTLEPNHDVVHEEATVTYLGPDGQVSHSEAISRLDHKIYKGSTYQERADGSWAHVGWARIHVRRDGRHPLFEGAFSVDHDAHHVQLSSSYMTSKHHLDPEIELEGDEYMVLWRDSDILPDASANLHTDLRRSLDARESCMSDDLHFNNDLDHPVYAELMKRSDRTWGAMPLGQLFGKRQIDSQPSNGNSAGVNLVSTIGNSAGCPSTRKVALVGVATDCTYTSTFAARENVTQNIITVMNSASQVWENSFNISLGLRNLTISDANCPGTPQQTTPWNQNCDANLDIQARLNLFSAWRGTVQDSNSHWTLLSNCRTGSAVGLAWLGQACNQQAQTSSTGNGNETVSGANFVAKTGTEWQVIAHETGHTFGAVHDCTSDTCDQRSVVAQQQCCPFSSGECAANGQYIMNPSTTPGANTFSPCTVGNICSAIGRNSVHTQCLSDNKDVTTITGQQCGNGIVEGDEDCDCGGPAGCDNNPCCNPTTCKFRGSAVCDDSNEDCCRSCQFASASTVCRPSTGECDPEERCTGNTANCPADQTAPDGQSCTLGAGSNTTSIDISELRCASGQCTSRDLQCKTLMGSYLHDNDTYACDSSSCLLRCASPSLGYNTCASLNTNLLGGTPCGGGGHCNNGHCDGSSFGGQVSSWVNDHKGLVIGIASAVGGLALLLFLSCIWRCCKRGRNRPPRVPAHAVPPAMVASEAAGGNAGPNGPGMGGWYAPPPGPSPGPPPVHVRQWDEPSGWRPSNPSSPGMQYAAPTYGGGWNGPPPPVPQHGAWGGSQRYA
ncbi:hypothetical protein FH972_023164 [Carpinus fangiana]|uniref:Disintegrin domain-containing protein n=1 Tax=Carpinus fangiana TaxID=176857 RepID=A0A5N6KUD1_9ROSI|nr:hypothetical protein FH972_023164 [Carpinus fangiana]